MDKHQFPCPPPPSTSLPSSDVSLSNSILSLVIFLWGVQFRGSLLFSVHFGASNVANFILGTAIRPQNMTGNSTKRMNEFAMRRTRETGKGGELKWGRTEEEGELAPLTIPIAAVMLCVASFVSAGNTKRGAGRGIAREGGRGRQVAGEEGRCRNTLANAVACKCCALYVFMLNVIIRRTDKCI